MKNHIGGNHRSLIHLKFDWYFTMEILSLNSALIVSLTSITASLALLLSISSGHMAGAKVSDNSDFSTDIDDTL